MEMELRRDWSAMEGTVLPGKGMRRASMLVTRLFCKGSGRRRSVCK